MEPTGTLEAEDRLSRASEVHARQALVRGASLSWMHWAIIGVSILITVSAWYISNSQLQAKNAIEFDRQVDHIVDLVGERMKLYENALLGGVALHDANAGHVDVNMWRAYATSLRIEESYPGINGIGVIRYVAPEQLAAYLATERAMRPDFAIHPEHAKAEYWPITYIEPEAPNSKAVGLDIAFEENRHQGILRARDTGRPQVTGPITLVQDAQRTPGFLFYAPYYEGGTKPVDVEARRASIIGVTYAPFIFSKLMQGTLASERRQVYLRIIDADMVLFDDAASALDTNVHLDPDPIFRRTVDVDMYGRTWVFDFQSSLGFREAFDSKQPTLILFGGVLIDLALAALFFLLAAANRRALGYADAMTAALEQKSSMLEKSNQALNDFAYIASHDLKEPLRGLYNHACFLLEDYGSKLGPEGETRINRMIALANRQEQLIKDLLHFSRLGQMQVNPEPVDVAVLLKDISFDLEEFFSENEASVSVDGKLPALNASKVHVREVFQNLIINGVKYNRSSPKTVKISHEPEVKRDGRRCRNVYLVRDNGIGIEPEFHEAVFKIFKRLNSEKEFGKGSGAGLTFVKKIVELYGGTIWIESEPGRGTTVFLAFG